MGTRRENGTSATDLIFLGLFPDVTHISLLVSIIFLSYIVALTGNSTLILLIWVESRLHTPMYLLLSQLSAMDVILVSTTIPRMVTDFWVQRRTISRIGCGVQMLFYVAVTGSESILLTSMSYDRYVAVCSPLRYSVVMSSSVCFQMAAFSWVMGFLNSLVHTGYTMHFPVCGSREIHHFFCEVPAILKLSCEDTSGYEMLLSVTGIVFTLLPFVIILTSYSLIFLSVFHMRSPEGQSKALATCSCHLTVVSLYLGPGCFACVIPQSLYSAEAGQAVSLFYNILTPVLNPLIYSLRNKEVMGAFKRLLGLGVCSQIKSRKLWSCKNINFPTGLQTDLIKTIE